MKKLKKTKIFIFGKKSHNAEKTERGDPLGFFNIHSVAKHQKNAEGNPLGKFFSKKKSRSAEKNERVEPLVSPGMVCYAEKQEKPFWFSSLDQIVQFGAIIFCRTFVELFWSVRVDRKKKSHYNSRVSLHEAPTKKGKRSRPILRVRGWMIVMLFTKGALSWKDIRRASYGTSFAKSQAVVGLKLVILKWNAQVHQGLIAGGLSVSFLLLNALFFSNITLWKENFLETQAKSRVFWQMVKHRISTNTAPNKISSKHYTMGPKTANFTFNFSFYHCFIKNTYHFFNQKHVN